MTLLDWILVLVAVIGTVHVSVLKKRASNRKGNR